MGTSSYDKITSQILNNQYLKAEFMEMHYQLFSGFEVTSRKCHFSKYESSVSLTVVARNTKDISVTMYGTVKGAKQDVQSKHISFPGISRDVMRSVLQPYWKSTIKTYNIPLNKFVDKLHNEWSNGDSIKKQWPEFHAMYTKQCGEAYTLLSNAMDEDLEDAIKQSAMEFFVNCFSEYDHISKYLTIDDVRSLAELEHIRRIHK